MIKTFFKGMLMGICDIIPGVSGGTIAFILGIYERLINAIKNINIKFYNKENLRKMDLKFLIPLGLGIVVAFGVGSRIVPYLLDNYPAYTFAFFFGLILGSIKLIHKKSKRLNLRRILAGVLMFLFAFWIAGLKTLTANHSYGIVFFSGILAISAMLLPGISGSFILLLLGQYKFMLEALKNFKVLYIVSFLIGAIIGLLGFSRLLSYLLKKYHSVTMWALIGLMLGALRVPFDNIVFVKELYPGLGFVWSLTSVVITSLLFLLGIFIIIKIGKLDKDSINV